MPEHDPRTYDLESMAAGLLGTLERSGAARSGEPLEQAAGLALAMRALQLLCLHRLQPQRDSFPATNRALMAVPEPRIEAGRDALALSADFLGVIEIIDLISGPGLECVAPQLHRGWQDRRRSCAQAREISAGAFGFSITGEERQQLLGALAICNRVFCIPPPVTLDRGAVQAAFAPVLTLIERAAGPGMQGAGFDNLVQRVMD